jgi:hypothetical protein
VDLVLNLPEPDRQMGHRCMESRPLHWVTTTDIACRLPWTGSWTGASDNPSAASAISAMPRVICAASVCGAGGRASHNPPVVGSSPTSPTVPITRVGPSAGWSQFWCQLDPPKPASRPQAGGLLRCPLRTPATEQVPSCDAATSDCLMLPYSAPILMWFPPNRLQLDIDLGRPNFGRLQRGR